MTTDAEDRSTWPRNGQVIRRDGRRCYRPGEVGWEKRVKEWLERLRKGTADPDANP